MKGKYSITKGSGHRGDGATVAAIHRDLELVRLETPDGFKESGLCSLEHEDQLEACIPDTTALTCGGWTQEVWVLLCEWE